MSLTPEQINVIRGWIQKYSLQFYDGVFSMLDENGPNREVWNVTKVFSLSKPLSAIRPRHSNAYSSEWTLPSANVDEDNDRAYSNNHLYNKFPSFQTNQKMEGGSTLNSDALDELKQWLNEPNEPDDTTNTNWMKYVKNDDVTRDDFIEKYIRHPLDVLLIIAMYKIPFNGSKFVEYTNPSDDNQKFLNLLVYYLNFNQIWQRLVNTIRKLKSGESTDVDDANKPKLYTYNKSTLGTSNLDVTNFRPWGTFGAAGFGRNPNFYPFGGNLIPMGGFTGGGAAQRGGNGQSCSADVKRVVDAVLNSNGFVATDPVRQQIDTQLDANIKYETLINQKLQQVVMASQTTSFSGNNADVTKYLGELQKLLETLKTNQSLLFNTLRLSVSPTAIGYKVPLNQPTYRALGDMIGGADTNGQVLALLQRIATKLNA